MVGTNNNEDFSATHNPSARTDAERSNLALNGGAKPVIDQYLYVQLRPGTELVRKCLATLSATAQKHAEVDVDIAAFQREGHEVRITVGINFGPQDKIAKPSEEAIAAYGLVASIFKDMFDFLPRYGDEPTADQRAHAAEALDRLASMQVARTAALG